MSCRWLSAPLALVLSCVVAAQTVTCYSDYASNLVNYQPGSNHLGTPGTNALGNTPADYASLGDRGSLIVSFPDDFTNSGNGTIDLYVSEWNSNDGWWWWVKAANSATYNVLANAGWVNDGTYFRIPRLEWGTLGLDIDIELPGHAAGSLRFSELKFEDDGDGGNGAEIEYVRADFLCPPLPPVTGGCVARYASRVVSFSAGSSAQGTPATNALGNTPNTSASLGCNGTLVVSFDAPFSTSGNATVDLFIQELNNNDCYWVCLATTDPFTQGVLQGAGWTNNGTYFQIPQNFCGSASINIDQYLPGYAQGQLLFTEVMIEDSCTTSDGSEIILIRVDQVCPPAEPPSFCVPRYASRLDCYYAGSGAQAVDPTNVLGNTPSTYASLGSRGSLCVSFESTFSTSGTSDADLTVQEFGVVDCYRVGLSSNDTFTAAVMGSAGWNFDGTYYYLPSQYCGTNSIDIDALLPGFSQGQLKFLGVSIEDDGSAGDGAEIILIRAEKVCTPLECEPGYASEIAAIVPGFNTGTVPSRILGNTPADRHPLGNNGSIDLCFDNIYANSGNGNADLHIEEYSTPEGYYVLVQPATGTTEAALIAAGLAQTGGFFALPNLFSGTQDIDIDAFVPGFAAGALRFKGLRLVDDGNSPSGNGAEIILVRAESVCLYVARLGDRVWVDANCDGDQDADELGVAGVPVALYDQTCTNVLQVTFTDASANYQFYVDPGTYRVRVGYDTAVFTVTAAGQGGDPTKDSDLNPADGKTGPISLGLGEENKDVDAGLCVICTGGSASVTVLPGCGLPLDPILTADVPLLGAIADVTINAPIPEFANAQWFLIASPGNPVPIPVFPTTCTIYVDLNTMVLMDQGLLDANGDVTLSFPIPPIPALAGITVTLQARVCNPAVPGPIPAFPDWLTNGLTITFGCP